MPLSHGELLRLPHLVWVRENERERKRVRGRERKEVRERVSV